MVSHRFYVTGRVGTDYTDYFTVSVNKAKLRTKDFEKGVSGRTNR